MMTIELTDPSLLQTKAYIDGRWLDAENGEVFPVFNPANGELIAEVANIGEGETRAALVSAQKAMGEWRRLSGKARSIILRKWFDLIVANTEDLARIMTAEQGKVLLESRGEVTYGASFIEWFAEEAKRVYGDIIPTPNVNHRAMVLKQPVGVAAAITPWNFPNAMITRKAGPALAVGCAMVIKPAEETPLSALALAVLAERAGIPAGVLNILPTANAAEVGNELTANPTVRKLSFTGSTGVGKLLMRQSADTVKRLSMELGGNAPVIVFDDADLDLAVQAAAASKFRNSGQTCICVNRVLVQANIYDAFVEKFHQHVAEFKLGNGMDAGVTHGPVINKKAIDSIQQKVDQAVESGATVLLGGKPGDDSGYFYEPTILTQVNPDMQVFREEIFGPVAPVVKFDTEQEAIELANDTEYGLASYIFTQDVGRVWRVSEAIEYGMVGVNETAITSEVIPFGGVKESGQGREGSKYGMDDYLETKYVCLGGLQEG